MLSSWFTHLPFTSLVQPWFSIVVQALPAQAPGQNVDPRQMLLAQLKDVQAPASVDWWPPAPGWWILGALLITVFAGAAFFVVKRQRQARYRKLALQALENINSSEESAAKDSMQLLKRVFFTAYPKHRPHVAGIYGPDFLSLLEALTPKATLSPDAKKTIDSLMYSRPKAAAANSALIDELKSFAHTWIQRHPKNSRKVDDIIRSHSQPGSASSQQNKVGAAYV